MIGFRMWEARGRRKVMMRQGTMWPICMFILLFCNCTVCQVLGDSQSQGIDPQGPFASQLVTPNALRAPAKAREAADKALKALINKQQKEAERQLARALAIYPDYAKALTVRGILELRINAPAAIADLEHAIQVDPTYGIAYAVLGSVYNDSQQFENALDSLHQALPLLPEAWPVHYEMARALIAQHHGKEALGEVNEAIKGMSADRSACAQTRATVHYLRGIILVDQHEFSEARGELERTVKEEPSGNLAEPSAKLLAELSSTGNR